MARIQNEIIRLAIDTAAGVDPNRLSDLRAAYFGKARRSEIIAKINTITGGSAIHWHDAWEEFLRNQSVNNSRYIEEEREAFHKTSTYP